METRPLPKRARELIRRFAENSALGPDEPTLLPQLLAPICYKGETRSLAGWLAYGCHHEVLHWLYEHAIRRELEIKQRVLKQTEVSIGFKLHYAIACRLPDSSLDEIINTTFPDVIFRCQYEKKVPIDIAVIEGDIDRIRYLLPKMHISPCDNCCPRKFALHLAVEALNREATAILLEAGFSCHVRDADGNTPVHTLLQMDGNIDAVVDVMMTHLRCRINIPNNAHMTPFMLAVLGEREQLVRKLLDIENHNSNNHASLIVTQDNINNAFQLALRHEKMKMAKLLLPFVTGLLQKDREHLTMRFAEPAEVQGMSEGTPLLTMSNLYSNNDDPVFSRNRGGPF